MNGWSCPNDIKGECQHVPGKACDPGMKGCVLFGKYRFANTDKNSPKKERERLKAIIDASEFLSRKRF